jgi:phenylpyruvate tautomerase PptA (4-oxalocrotonate tautomerase family)
MFQDLTKFDVTKMLDASKVFAAAETTAKQAVGYIPDAQQREIAETVTEAALNFARAQNQAVVDFAAAVQAAVAQVASKSNA